MTLEQFVPQSPTGFGCRLECQPSADAFSVGHHNLGRSHAMIEAEKNSVNICEPVIHDLVADYLVV
jgi:hypothetical protein